MRLPLAVLAALLLVPLAPHAEATLNLCPAREACAHAEPLDESGLLTCEDLWDVEAAGAHVTLQSPAGTAGAGAWYFCYNGGSAYHQRSVQAWAFVKPLDGSPLGAFLWTGESSSGSSCNLVVYPMGSSECGYASLNGDCRSASTPTVQACWRGEPRANVLGASFCYTRNYQDQAKAVVVGNAVESPWAGYAGCLVFRDVLNLLVGLMP